MIDRYLSPAELKRLASALLVVLLFIGIAALFAFIVVPGLRYQAHATEAPLFPGAPGQTGWLDPTAYPAQKKVVIPPIDPKTVMTPTPALLQRGQELFAANCVACHGPKGLGDGPGGKGLKPAPRNFSQSGAWVNGYTLTGIYKTLDEGIKGTSMVAYQDIRRPDRMALAHYVRSLGAFDHGPENPAAREALEKVFSGSGETIPNRIPVSEAEVRLAKEYQAPRPLDANDPMVRRYVHDPVRASSTLAGIQGWEASEAVLARGVVSTLPGNGFDPAVATLPPAQWKLLRDALVRK